MENCLKRPVEAPTMLPRRLLDKENTKARLWTFGHVGLYYTLSWSGHFPSMRKQSHCSTKKYKVHFDLF